MKIFVQAVQQIMSGLLRHPALNISLRQRAKFEGWLKIELAAALASQGWNVRLERAYIGPNKDRCLADLALTRDYAPEILVMLKTVNTNFRFDGVENRTRPITMNIAGVTADIQKLSHLPPGLVGYVLFTVFPLSSDEAKRQSQFSRHLGKLKTSSVELVADAYVGRSDGWGVAWYLGQVK